MKKYLSSLTHSFQVMLALRDAPATTAHRFADNRRRSRVQEEETMLRTRLCDVLGIDLPIILAGMGAGATSAEFAAAVSNQGGLGSVGSLFRAADTVKRDIDVLPTPTPQRRVLLIWVAVPTETQ